MNTATIDRPAAVTKPSKAKATVVTSPMAMKADAHKAKAARGATSAAPKAQLPKALKEAAETFAKDVAKKTPAKPAVKKLEKKLPKPKEPKAHRVSAMWVIRTNMAEAIATNGKPATVEMISKACADAGVPKEEGTIKTIISDFMQTYLAMQGAGLVKSLA